MPWTDLHPDTAVEHELLRRALPVVPETATSGTRVVRDTGTRSTHVKIQVSDTIGATPPDCVDLLGLRPVLVAAAWKILDRLVEIALEEAAHPPGRNGRYSIEDKAKNATTVPGPPMVPADAWEAIGLSYASTVELRHSLVHRRVVVAADGALVGSDAAGAPTRPLSTTEQESFVRAVIRLRELVVGGVADDRLSSDLRYHLQQLHGLHGKTFSSALPLVPIPEITVILHPAQPPAGGYVLDVADLLANPPVGGADRADLVLQFSDRPGTKLSGRIEAAPPGQVVVDPDAPPGWLS